MKKHPDCLNEVGSAYFQLTSGMKAISITSDQIAFQPVLE